MLGLGWAWGNGFGKYAMWDGECGIIDEGLWIKNCGRMDWEDTDLELRAWKCGVGMQTFECGRASIK